MAASLCGLLASCGGGGSGGADPIAVIPPPAIPPTTPAPVTPASPDPVPVPASPVNPPAITGQPASQTVVEDAPLTFDQSISFALDSADNLYVAYTGYREVGILGAVLYHPIAGYIRQVTPSGVVTTVVVGAGGSSAFNFYPVASPFPGALSVGAVALQSGQSLAIGPDDVLYFEGRQPDHEGAAAVERLAAGSCTVNSAPLPAPALRACTLPLCSSTSSLTIVRPIPRPPGTMSAG